MADSINDAERQMAEHEVSIYRALGLKYRDRFGMELDMPVSRSDMREQLVELMAEDPEARELGARLATFHRSRSGGLADGCG